VYPFVLIVPMKHVYYHISTRNKKKMWKLAVMYIMVQCNIKLKVKKKKYDMAQ